MGRKEPNKEIIVTYSEHDDDYEIYCPHCGVAQVEHPINILMDSDIFAEWNCDECDKVFTLSATRLIQYITEI